MVALLTAAWLAFECSSGFLTTECLVYRAVVDSPPVADDIFARSPWFAPGAADLIEYRIATLTRDPDFLRPLLTAWLASTVQVCCIFILLVVVIRVVPLWWSCERRGRFHLSMPGALAASAISVFPKLCASAMLLHWSAEPMASLGRFGWTPGAAINAAMVDMTWPAEFGGLLLVVTWVVLVAFCGAVRAAAVWNPAAGVWVERTVRVAIWSIPIMLVAWLGLSLLVGDVVPYGLFRALGE
jgi:hypothetical protein